MMGELCLPILTLLQQQHENTTVLTCNRVSLSGSSPVDTAFIKRMFGFSDDWVLVKLRGGMIFYEL
jgi:hypothetical protein